MITAQPFNHQDAFRRVRLDLPLSFHGVLIVCTRAVTQCAPRHIIQRGPEPYAPPHH